MALRRPNPMGARRLVANMALLVAPDATASNRSSRLVFATQAPGAPLKGFPTRDTSFRISLARRERVPAGGFAKAGA